MKFDTQLVQLRRSAAMDANAVNSPLVRASTTTFACLADYKNSYDGIVFETHRYGRSGTNTTFELQSAMAQLEGAETCIATASGLSAIAAVLCAHAGPGKHLLVYDGVYGRTRTLCEKELARLGSTVEFFGPRTIFANVSTRKPVWSISRCHRRSRCRCWTWKQPAQLHTTRTFLSHAIRRGERRLSSVPIRWAWIFPSTPPENTSTAIPTSCSD